MSGASTLCIRHWQPNDRDAVAALIVGIQRDEFGLDIDLAAQPDLLDVAGFYGSGAGGFWVACDAGLVVGCIGLRDLGQGDGALRKMFVAPTHRGRGLSVAARLLDRLTAHAQAQQLHALFLGTTDRFLAAHRFYEKHGFLQIARTDIPRAFPVMAVDSRFYVRWLKHSA
jgi:GNAT superfamily N-acetyltransferase